MAGVHDDLTSDQARHLSSWLTLLSDELGRLAVDDSDGAAAAPSDPRVRHAQASAAALMTAFALTPPTPVDPRRRREALAITWIVRLPDLGPKAMRAYGPELSPEAAGRLDAGLAAISDALRMLIRADQ